MAKSFIPVTVRGRYFWRGDERFLIKGVVYQIHGRRADPLGDDRLDELRRDIALFRELGINALFVYSIDNQRNHDAAMSLLAEAGIYVLIGLSTPATAINRATPSTSYSSQLLEEYFATIDCMADYPNTLGIIVANSVLNSTQTTAAAPVIRAVTRDVKRYMSAAADATGQRRLPIGYSASTCRLILKTTFDYLSAGEPDESIDFFCYNNYNWCGQSNMHISGYNEELKLFADTPIPVFFSEYGCNLGGARLFQETTALYGPAMTRVFSGGFAREFFDEPATRYGLVRAEADSLVALSRTSAVTLLPDFHSLQARLADCAGVPPATDAGWIGTAADFPPQSAAWRAAPTVPQSAVDWDRATERFRDELWIDVEKQLEGLDDATRQNVIQAVMRMHTKQQQQQQHKDDDGQSSSGLWRWRAGRAQATR